ncbi:hypothetical protein CapIbe_020006 [Capra ibex]
MHDKSLGSYSGRNECIDGWVPHFAPYHHHPTHLPVPHLLATLGAGTLGILTSVSLPNKAIQFSAKNHLQ